jgi:hypothetical protein
MVVVISLVDCYKISISQMTIDLLLFTDFLSSITANILTGLDRYGYFVTVNKTDDNHHRHHHYTSISWKVTCSHHDIAEKLLIWG